MAGGDVFAAPECSDTPATGNHIECTENDQSTSDIDIDATGIDIDLTGTGAVGAGVFAEHKGTGNIDIDITGQTTGGTTTPSTIDTMGQGYSGIRGVHTGNGALGITLQDTQIRVQDTDGFGVIGIHQGQGDLTIDLMSGVTIDTQGSQGTGTYVVHQGADSNAMSNVILRTDGISVTTAGSQAAGLWAARHNGPGNVRMTVEDSTFVTDGDDAPGVYGYRPHVADGGVDMDIQGGSVTTRGLYSIAVLGSLQGMGNVDINVRDAVLRTESTAKDTQYGETFAPGIQGWIANTGTGNVDIDVRGGSVTTRGVFSPAVYGYHDGTGNIDIDVRDATIATESAALADYGDTLSHGIYGRIDDADTGNIDIDIRDGSVTTAGTFSYGLYGDHRGIGSVGITSSTDITTTGPYGHGIVAYQRSETASPREIDVRVNGGTIDVQGTGARGIRIGWISDGAPYAGATLDDDGYRQQTVMLNGAITSAGEGIYLAGGGRVTIGPQGSINSGSNIAILATGTVPEVMDDPQTMDVDETMAAILPKLHVNLNPEGQRMTGDGSWLETALGGGWILNDGGETTIAVNNTVLHVGATGVVENAVARNGVWDVRMRAQGVRVTDRSTAVWILTPQGDGVIADRDFSAEDFMEMRRPPPPPPRCPAGQVGTPPNCTTPPPEPEVHRVDERRVTGADMMAGVQVEGDGEVYIGSQGSIDSDSGIAILATGDAPDLLVDMDLDGRSLGGVIGDDWIINDGGGTTIVVNGVTLHDGATGVVADAVAPNGAFDVRTSGEDSVRILAEGVRVLDRTDPDPANWVVSERAAGVIADRDFNVDDFIHTADTMDPVDPTDPDPAPPPMFIEEYAPRAALYEALSDVLLGLDTALPGHRSGVPGSPLWIELSGSTGSRDFDRSTVDTDYDMGHRVVSAGATALQGAHWSMSASVHNVSGSAEVSSPVRGGDIDARGTGMSFDAHWRSERDYYAGGHIAWTDYDLKIASDNVGRLVSSVDAGRLAVQMQAGRRLNWGEHVHWSPQVRFSHTWVRVDDFTDAVGARASFSDAKRTLASLGLSADTPTSIWGAEGLLWGSLVLEHRFGDTDTTSSVSGEQLRAEAPQESVQVAVGTVLRRGPWSGAVALSARQAGSGNHAYTARLNLGLQF